MKKILALMGALALGATTASTVVACGINFGENNTTAADDKIYALEAEIAKLNQQIAENKAIQEANQKKINDQIQKNQELVEKLKIADEKTKELQETTDSQLSEINNLKQIIEVRKAEIDKLHKDVDQLNFVIAELEQDNAFLENKINDLNHLKRELEDHLTIKQLELTKLNEIKKMFESKIEFLNSKTINSKEDQDEFLAELKSLIEQLSDFKEEDVQTPFFEDLIKYLSNVQTKINNKDLAWTTVQEEVKNVVDKIVNEQPRLNEKIESKKAEILEEQENLKNLESKIAGLEKEKETAKIEIESLLKQKAELDKTLREQEIEIEKLKEDKIQLESDNAKLSETTKTLRETIESLNETVDYQKTLIEESEQLINELRNEQIKLLQDRFKLKRLLTSIADLDEVIEKPDLGEITINDLSGSVTAQSQRILAELQRKLKEENPLVLLDSVAFLINDKTEVNHKLGGRLQRTTTSVILRGIDNSKVYSNKTITITFTIKTA